MLNTTTIITATITTTTNNTRDVSWCTTYSAR
jgi:hypothetical protein